MIYTILYILYYIYYIIYMILYYIYIMVYIYTYIYIQIFAGCTQKRTVAYIYILYMDSDQSRRLLATQ